MSKNIVELNEGNFESEVIKADSAVLVDFWASWCAPCLMLAPTLEKVAEDLSSSLKVGKLNVDENHTIASQFGIMSIPTLILFKDGKELNRIVGALGEAELTRRIKEHLG